MSSFSGSAQQYGWFCSGSTTRNSLLVKLSLSIRKIYYTTVYIYIVVSVFAEELQYYTILSVTPDRILPIPTQKQLCCLFDVVILRYGLYAM